MLKFLISHKFGSLEKVLNHLLRMDVILRTVRQHLAVCSILDQLTCDHESYVCSGPFGASSDLEHISCAHGCDFVLDHLVFELL